MVIYKYWRQIVSQIKSHIDLRKAQQVKYHYQQMKINWVGDNLRQIHGSLNALNQNYKTGFTSSKISNEV